MASIEDYLVGGAEAVWERVFTGFSEDEKELFEEAAGKSGALEFLETDLLVASRRLVEGTVPYRADATRMPHVLTNLHNGQRKLFVTELYLLSKFLKSHDEPCVIVYAGAAPGTHHPYLAKLFPRAEFHLYDPAPFSPAVLRHPRMHTHRQFFTDETAGEWAARRPDFFLCDIRITAGDKVEFEKNVKKDMDAQRRWTETISPARAAMLKFRLPFLDAAGERLVPEFPEEAEVAYLKGDVIWQPWAPYLSSETRIVVDFTDGPPGEQTIRARDYESACYTHNIVARPALRFGDRPKVALTGYDGSWDSRAEVAIWERYLALRGAGDVARYMNQLSGAVKQPLRASVGARSRGKKGILHGYFPGLYGTEFLNALAVNAVRNRDSPGMPDWLKMDDAADILSQSAGPLVSISGGREPVIYGSFADAMAPYVGGGGRKKKPPVAVLTFTEEDLEEKCAELAKKKKAERIGDLVEEDKIGDLVVSDTISDFVEETPLVLEDVVVEEIPGPDDPLREQVGLYTFIEVQD